MKATRFESRHRVLLHRLIITAAFLTYFVDRDDVVWHFIKNDFAHRHVLEHLIFAIAALLAGIAAALCTWTQSQEHSDASNRYPKYLGDWLYAVALGTLAPLAGFVILAGVEGIRIVRLAVDDSESLNRQQSDLGHAAVFPMSHWDAVQQESFKWGMFLVMVAFAVTLRDRLAEGLAVLVGVVGLLLTSPYLRRLRRRTI